MKVCKFGGSSLADAGQVKKVCDIMLADETRKVVVVSAPGKRDKGDTKVTDMLIACAERALSGKKVDREIAEIVERYASIQRELGLDPSVVVDIESDLRVRAASDRRDVGAFIDLMKAAGEDNSGRIVAAALAKRGAKAEYANPGAAGMVLEGEAGNAVLREESYELLSKSLSAVLDNGGLVVFPGFFGRTVDGRVATFPRGGSDITGAILAAAIKADVYENFTDVDTVYAVDPRIVPEVTHGIKEMTYREMRELAYAGFGVFHDEAVMPAFRANIPINIRNTNHPGLPGTMIVPSRQAEGVQVVGIASETEFVSIYIEKYMMNREVGFGRKVLQILEDEGVPFEHIPTGIDNMSILIRGNRIDEAKEKHIVSRIKSELNPDSVYCSHNNSIVMVVGEGMQSSIGVAERAAKAFRESGVSIEMINQGSSETSIMFGVNDKYRESAVRALYKEFFA